MIAANAGGASPTFFPVHRPCQKVQEQLRNDVINTVKARVAARLPNDCLYGGVVFSAFF
jgi:hypothetical protein